MSEPIIVALERGHGHAEVLALAAHVARLLQESVVLTNVAQGNRGWVLDPAPSGPTDRQRTHELKVAAQLLPSDVASSTATPHAATIADGLEAVAAHVGAGLIVLGASMGESAACLVEADLGLALLRRAPCAILMAPRTHDVLDPNHPWQVTSLAVGWDRSPEAADALLVAIDLAARAECALTMLHVLGEPSVFRTPESVEVEDTRRAGAAAEMQAAAAAIDPSVAIVPVVCEGGAVDRLRAISARVDLLVVGSRRVGAVRRLGGVSVSEELLHNARCPLLVIPVGARFPAVPAAADIPAPANIPTTAGIHAGVYAVA